MAAGGGGVGYSASSSSSSSLRSSAAFDSSGWAVNYGSQGTPSWVWAAGFALAAVGLLVYMRKGR